MGVGQLVVERPAPHHRMVWLGAFAVGLVLGILQPLFVVAVGGFGVLAGPSYVGLLFLVTVAVGLVDTIVVMFASRIRRTTVQILAVCASLALGMAGGNVVASTLHVSFAAQPTVPEPTGAAWSTTGSMRMARQHHSATLLRDGRVLVAGGMGADESTTPTAELYDPPSGSWAATGTMITAIYQPIALRLVL